jgi:transposase
MSHVSGQSRYQLVLFPQALDDVVPVDHSVRVVDAFVDTLDLRALGFERVDAEATGRPGYAPADLLKLYVYGYANQLRSSRRLERETERNIEVLWLINRLRPSFKTIADFRKDHAEAIVGACRAFVMFCRAQSLVGGGTVAIDGTKIGAVASRKKVITPKKLAERIAAVEREIKAHLEAMDQADAEEAAAPSAQIDVAAAVAELAARGEDLQRQAQKLAKEDLNQRVEGEEDARLMRTPNHGRQVAYNAQTAVDAKNGLIVAFDLTNEGNDERQLHPMASQARDALGVDNLTAVADTGYSNGEQGERCANDNITAIVPRPKTVNPTGDAFFSRDAFTYDAQNDNYKCPAGETLKGVKVSRTEQKKEYKTTACADCPLRPRCTAAPQRSITRGFHEDARQAMHARTASDPRWMKIRRSVVEHPFGTLKWMMGSPRFLVRGLKKAKAEFGLAALGYNMKRAIKILGVGPMIQALTAV